MLGQIPSFMEALNLSYDEVVHKIPYRNLLVMQKDKQRPCYGTKIQHASGKELAARRRQNKQRGGNEVPPPSDSE